jgi:antitoxin YefM
MDKSISYSKLRSNLKVEFDAVCNDHSVLQITRKNGANLVLMSEDDYTSIAETLYLLNSKNNLKKLLAAIKRQGGTSLRDIRKKYPI